MDAIPWATAKADEKRTIAESGDAHNRAEAAELGLGEPAPRQPSHEESLLDVLLAANQDLIEAFRIHDGTFSRPAPTLTRADLERQRRQIDEEREVAARSLVEQKFDRSTALETADGNWLATPPDANGAGSSSSRSPSPTRGYVVEDAPPPPMPTVPRPSELPRGAAPASRNPYAAVMQSSPEPPRPVVQIPARPPSPVAAVHDDPDEFVSSLPERSFASHNPYRRYPSGSSVSSAQYTMPVNTVDDGESLPTPVEPSAKALGKLRRLSTRADGPSIPPADCTDACRRRCPVRRAAGPARGGLARPLRPEQPRLRGAAARRCVRRDAVIALELCTVLRVYSWNACGTDAECTGATPTDAKGEQAA